MFYKTGNFLLIVGIAALIYASMVYFRFEYLWPNTADCRLPSVYLMFGAIACWIAGSLIRTISKRTKPHT
jgi:hypothetical protein